MTKYVLTMTEEQARRIITALDFYSRMRMGQWRELIDLCLSVEREDMAEYCEKRDKAAEILLLARDVVMPELIQMHSLYGSYGVYKFEDSTKAWHILQSIRSCIAWHKKPKGGLTVDYDRPMGEAPECEAVEDET